MNSANCTHDWRAYEKTVHHSFKRHAGAQRARWEGERTTDSDEVMYEIKEIQFVHNTAWLYERHSWTLLASAASNRAVVFPLRHKRQHIKGSCALSQRHHRVFLCLSSLSLLRSVWNAADLNDVRAIKKKKKKKKRKKSHQNTSTINKSTCKQDPSEAAVTKQKDYFKKVTMDTRTPQSCPRGGTVPDTGPSEVCF